MIVKDRGRYYSVCISENDIYRFNGQWPGSRMKRAFCAEFDKRNGDLVDLTGKGSRVDGPEVTAIVEDAQALAIRKLKLGYKDQGFKTPTSRR